MALTSQEEALTRQLLDQQAAILSLAGNEATITSKLGATKVTLADLVAASVLADADLLLTRQGTTDKSVRADILADYIKAELDASFAPRVSPALTGTPTAPTATAGTNNTQLATTAFAKAEAAAAALLAVPPGTVAYFAATTSPAGWLRANGATVSRTTYANLFAVIGTTFGAGDGHSTFNLPDLRGEFIRGWDDGRGVDVGREIGSHQLDALQQHTHKIATRAQNNGGNAVARGEGGSWGAPSTEQVDTHARTAAETRPRNVALLAMIKY